MIPRGLGQQYASNQRATASLVGASQATQPKSRIPEPAYDVRPLPLSRVIVHAGNWLLTPRPWTQGTPYPTTIVRYGFAQTATHFYVFGGVDNGFTTNAVNRMDFATGVWESRAPMPFSGEAPPCALMESTGIVYCADGHATNSFAAYDIASNTWTPLAPDPFVTDH